MTLVRAHFRAELVQYLRTPSFYLPLASYPVLLYLAVGVPLGGGDDRRLAVLVGYVLFSVLGTVTFQFGVGVAVSRQSAWERWLFTVPVSASTRLTARLAVACVFAVLFVVPVVAAGALLGGVPADPDQAARITAAVLAGSVPLGLMGLAMGYWFPVRGALGLANLVYLPLSFVGGLFSGGTGATSTGPVEDARAPGIELFLPTGAWSELTHAAIGGWRGSAPIAVAVLLLYTAAFAALAVVGYRRSQAVLFT
ncbi:ABC transporter permease [Planctomonas deserti]|uniref:ABC transporter permease n=1 Tax=Planctomonas deserti TaxID=2144185 RepID=UPI000D37AC6A|nr:ABC transporter permease [Planctomonas deserti]